jgi:Ca2+-transporting ATPase
MCAAAEPRTLDAAGGAGLTSAQAERQLVRHGPNAMPMRKPVTWLGAAAWQLTDTVIVVLLVAMLLTVLMGDYPDTVVIAAVIVLNSALSAGQEVRSSRALAALAALTAPRATVLRDGVPCEIAAAEVVPGDLLVLAAGDVVAADATVLRAEALQLDESMLTGESLPVDRRAHEPLAAGTVVVRGRARAVVDTTGAQTAIGRIGRGLDEGSQVRTPLQQQLAQLGRALAIGVAVAAVAVTVLNLVGGRGLEYSVTLGISLAVAAIPESLPAVVALTLALAARRMVAAGILVRRLAAVEALGSVTVLGTDKTGTLTSGELSVTDTWTPSTTADGRVRRRDLIEASVLCNDADGEGVAGRSDDPLEVALVRCARDAGIDVPALRAASPRIDEEPFDAARARMLTVHRTGRGVVSLVKGSPEVVLALCADTADAEGAAQFVAARSEAGGRVLAVAVSDLPDRWQLLGLIVFADRPRPQARGVVGALRRAGIRPVMITGDHPGTAHAVAQAVGIGGASGVGNAARSVYARVRPEQKTDIVRGLQAAGDLVAMTGDGVNDAPALRAADVGVAMGVRGTEVARQAADLVLTGDDLGAVVNAVGEGRRAYDNLRRFLHYALSGGFAEIIVMLAGPAFGLPVPLGPGQILWVNLLTHGLPGVAIGNEPARPDVLSRPPRPPRRPLVDRALAARVTVLGATIAASCLGAAFWAQADARPWRAYAFVTLTVAQLAAALALRPSWRRRNPALVGAVALNLALIVLAVRWGVLETLLRTDPLSGTDILRCVVAAVPAAVVAALQAHRPAGRGDQPRDPAGRSALGTESVGLTY